MAKPKKKKPAKRISKALKRYVRGNPLHNYRCQFGFTRSPITIYAARSAREAKQRAARIWNLTPSQERSISVGVSNV